MLNYYFEIVDPTPQDSEFSSTNQAPSSDKELISTGNDIAQATEIDPEDTIELFYNVARA